MDILLHWLQDEVKLPNPVDDLAEHFSNGYALALVLHNTNQMTPAEFGQCVQDGKSDSKIQNYCQLFQVFRRLGIKFDARVAQQLMLRKPGIPQRVLYELRTVLAPLSRVRVEPESSVQARIQYAKWQAKEVERLVKEEREAQAKADAEEAERLGITIAEVVAMRKASASGRQAAEDGEDEDGLGPLPSDAATDAGEGGDEASGATPRSLRRMPSGSSVYSADDAGSVMDAEASHGPSRRCVAGSPLDAQQLSALLPTQGSLLSPLASTVLGAGAESGGLAADSTAQSSSVLPVEDVSAEDAGMIHDTSKTSLGAGATEQAGDAAAEGKASDEADAGESALQRFSRLCPGPADWPWEEPAGIRPRTKVVLHHPLLHRQAPLALDAEEWEALVHTWADASILELPAACPTTAPRRDLQLALHQVLQAYLDGPSVEGSSDVSGHDDVPEGKAGEPPSPPAELSTPASVVQEQFAQGVWPPIAGDVTTSGIVHEVKPVPVSAPGAVWIDWDVAFVEGQSAPA
ncbi:Spef2, partial [Symbiodinium sp. KB8]